MHLLHKSNRPGRNLRWMLWLNFDLSVWCFMMKMVKIFVGVSPHKYFGDFWCRGKWVVQCNGGL